MKKIVFALFILITAFNSNAQIKPVWVVNSPNYQFSLLEIDDNKNVFVVAQTTIPFEYFVQKYDSSGSLLWSSIFKDPLKPYIFPRDMAVDINGNVVVAGSVEDPWTSADFYTVKYDSLGTQLWARSYTNPALNGDDEPIGLDIDNQGNIYVVGTSLGNSPPWPNPASWDYYDYLTIKYSSTGVEEWVRIFHTPGGASDYLNDMAVDENGNVYVTGSCVNIDSVDHVNGIWWTHGVIKTIKYNTAGSQQWIQEYDHGTLFDKSIAIDVFGNVVVTGAKGDDVLLIKYSPSGAVEWVNISNENSFRFGDDIKTDNQGNIYVLVYSGLVDAVDYELIKYDSAGIQQWSNMIPNIYLGRIDFTNSSNLIIDNSNNIFVHGYSRPEGSEIEGGIIKFDSAGNKKWELVDNFEMYNPYLKLDDEGFLYNISGVGHSDFGSKIGKYSEDISLQIMRPKQNHKFMAGEKDTIKWVGGQPNQFLEIEYSINNGSNYTKLDVLVPADSNYFIWDIPDSLLSTQAKIKITDWIDPSKTDVSAAFRVKPYVLTRLDENGNYYEYKKNRDQWGFANFPGHMWPLEWYNQFDYQGTDPFTNRPYSQWQGGGVFATAQRSNHMDWVSWVNTFGMNACYINIADGTYSPLALEKWSANKYPWGGSCFGIAAANALAFKYKQDFQNKYPDLPAFDNPISVVSTNPVKKIVNELFAHQYGNPSQANDNIGWVKTPNQTLADIKQMLKEDNAVIRTLSIYNNNGGGGHTILAFGLEQDSIQKHLYYLKVYDNSNPNSNNPITINTLANGGNGSWNTPDWVNLNGTPWGGNTGIYLEIISGNYFNGATLPQKIGSESPFLLSENNLEINFPTSASIKIEDTQGNVTGYFNNSIFNEIPNSFPRFIKNGSAMPPYGYSLLIDFGGGGGNSSINSSSSYSVTLDDFQANNVGAFFFTGNKSFSYERSGAAQTQTDKLFFDGGLSIVNPDAQPKTVKLTNIIKSSGGGGNKQVSPKTINNSDPEKVFVIRSINMVQNDSIKIVNTYNDDLEIINFGSAKNYQIELNYATTGGLGVFVNTNVTLPQNSTHQLVPEWFNINELQLMIQVDEGNDGTIDSTYTVENQWEDPVPVELTAFTATNTAKGVQLNWQTSTEVSNYGFEVERRSISANNNNTETWSKLGFVPGSGNSNSLKLYSFTDKTAKEGKYLYRLKQIDTDGKFQFSSVIEIDVKNIPLVFALEQNFPNPFNPSTTISWQSPVGSHQTLKVYDVLGNEVATLVDEYREAGRYEIAFDASQLASGIYLYKLQVNPAEGGKSSFTSIKKMIVIK